VRPFDELVDEAMAAPVEGWDFSWSAGRRVDLDHLPWRWHDLIGEAVREVGARTLVDLGTGGGEVVAGWLGEAGAARPELVVATEAWPPNVPVAAARLGPLGVAVVADEGAPDNIDWAGPGSGGRLPFRPGSMDVVIDRHEAYAPDEVRALLAPHGRFLTQQVGGENEVEWLDLFGRPPEHQGRGWGLAEAVGQAEAAGFEVLARGEAFPRVAFHDVGAVVHYHRLIPWFVPGFDPTGADRSALETIHRRITTDGPLVLRSHRYWFVARPR
jgi:hypothetical protein